MDVRYINPFLVAIQNLFETMIDIPFTLGKPTLKRSQQPPYEISSIIGLSGDVSGCVVISLSREIALQMASALLGEPMEELDADCTDAIGEIANMIAGNAKTDFPEVGCNISVPSVVTGQHKVAYPSGIPIITIPCSTERGALVIDIALKVKAEDA